MLERTIQIATLVGVILFMTDLVFGWMTLLISPFPVIWAMAIVIGIIAGKAGDAVFATLLTWFLGILIATILAPLIFAGVWWSETEMPLGPALIIFPIFVVLWSTRGVFMGLEYEGPWIAAIAAAAIFLIIWLIVAPVLYLLSFVIAAIGGFIGKRVHQKLGITQPESISQPTETPGYQ